LALDRASGGVLGASGPWAWLADAIGEGKIEVMMSTDRQLGTLFGLAIGEL